MHEILLPRRRISRFLGAYRHPDQAALAARVPLVGRRVPGRAYWRRQGVRPVRVSKRVAADAASLTGAVRAGARARGGKRRGRGAGQGAEKLVAGPGPARARGHRRQALMALAGAIAGAALMYLLDPSAGRRRRALIRDKAAHMRRVLTRAVPARMEKRGRFFRGVAHGIVHDTTDLLAINGHEAPDDETLVARVRSEVLRGGEIKAGEIHLDAYEGCVTLRGQLERPEDIRRLVRGTAHVDGVREVRNYLHLRGTPPPNKGSVYALADAGDGAGRP